MEYDPRRYVIIAVADPPAKCVQLLKYYWWKNHLYSPRLVYHCSIGGIHKGCGLRLSRPTSVSFCNGSTLGGDLAICDSSLQKVFIMNKQFIVMHSINTSYSPDWRIFDDATAGRSIRPDPFPESVAFSADRMLCVSYRQGGILVYKPYTIAPIGKFVDIKVS